MSRALSAGRAARPVMPSRSGRAAAATCRAFPPQTCRPPGKPIDSRRHLASDRSECSQRGPSRHCQGETAMRATQVALLAFVPLLLLAAASRAEAQDAKAGETTFKRFCAVCHTVTPGQNRIGPSLYGVVGRKSGSAPGYSYSDANKNSGITWTEEELDKYLTNPQQVVPHTKMLFA